MLEGSGDHRGGITAEGPHTPCHLFSDNQQFLANTNCSVLLLLHYVHHEVGVPKTGEECGEETHGQGSEVAGSSLAVKSSSCQEESSLNPDSFLQHVLNRITGLFCSLSPSLAAPITLWSPSRHHRFV